MHNATKTPHVYSAPLRVARNAMSVTSDGRRESKTLAEWRSLDAYVLLGDPGAGKSWSFDDECAACGGISVHPRDIIADIASTNVGNKTVFIDALDEVRAGASDGRVPFDAIRAWLNKAGRPRFRLSCREADWLGQTDERALERVAPGEAVAVLHLMPLSHDDVLAVLRHRSTEVPDSDTFWNNAEKFGLIELFGNPLLLDLTIKAVAAGGGIWPSSRKDIYGAACRQLATETSDEHLAVSPHNPGDIDRILDDAGLLCALLLLSNKQSLALREMNAHDTVSLSTLPADLQLSNAKAAISSNVFTTVAGSSTPRHRSIAEYLAAQALAKRIEAGLPLGRVLALILGFDGRPVDSLRGLFAWLVVHRGRDRAQLIQLDPLGVVVNGDVGALSASERLELIGALAKAAQRDRGFRRNAWVSHPFGPLATAGMEETYTQLLGAPQRDDAHQAFMDCVFDALCHGHAMEALTPALEVWVEDSNASFGNRLAAYSAWKHNGGFQPAKALSWLGRLAAGTITDHNDRLASALLTDLYPQHVAPRDVLKFLRPFKHRHQITEYSMFWRYSLFRNSRPQDFPELADSWIEARPASANDAQDYENRRFRGELLASALVHRGDAVSTERLYAWLGICLDEYGCSTLVDALQRKVAEWLEARPNRIKAVVELDYKTIQPNKQGQRPFWQCRQRLHNARLPGDWLSWLLEQVAATTEEELAAHCFRQVAIAIVDPPGGFDVPTMEEIERWVESHSAQWPMAQQWLQEAWTSDLEDWRGDHYRRERKYEVQRSQTRAERRRSLEPYVAVLASGTAPIGLLHNLALAHEGRFSYIRGETPLERVQDYLVSDEATAYTAIAALEQVLARDDIPSADDILNIDAQGKYHRVRPVALLAASRVFRKSSKLPQTWLDELTQKLVAFYLTDGTGEMPAWYRKIVADRPELVAPIFMQYATPRLRHKGNFFITGLWALSREADHRELARRVLPALLDRFPLRASEASRGELNRSLLAALHVLDDREAAQILCLKLAQPGLDAGQRISWLVAALPYHPDAVERLAEWIGKNNRRAVTLGVALHEQDSLRRSVPRLLPSAVRKLIEMLAPITPRERDSGSGMVTVADNREQTVSGLFNALSSNPSDEARDELCRLRDLTRLDEWHEAVEYCINAQKSVAREANFHAAEPLAVALAIANLTPANVADLRSLAMHNLCAIEAELRGTDTFLLRQFWKGTSDGAAPNDENLCRDLLLHELRNRLKALNIHVEREASAAADKRADMRVEFMRAGQRIAVPIEVKKENHDKLWTAWKDQLQCLYTVDPAAGGYGVYLMLWFGNRPRSTPGGVKPCDAMHMQELIIARIPESERHRLAVKVMDLSLPASM